MKKDTSKINKAEGITYGMQVLSHVSILAYELRHLLLEAIIFLHQQLVHGIQFSVYTLKSSGFFSLLLSTPTFIHH